VGEKESAGKNLPNWLETSVTTHCSMQLQGTLRRSSWLRTLATRPTPATTASWWTGSKKQSDRSTALSSTFRLLLAPCTAAHSKQQNCTLTLGKSKYIITMHQIL